MTPLQRIEARGLAHAVLRVGAEWANGVSTHQLASALLTAAAEPIMPNADYAEARKIAEEVLAPRNHTKNYTPWEYALARALLDATATEVPAALSSRLPKEPQ